MTRDVWSCLNPKPLGHTYLKLNVNYRNFFMFFIFLTHIVNILIIKRNSHPLIC